MKILKTGPGDQAIPSSESRPLNEVKLTPWREDTFVTCLLWGLERTAPPLLLKKMRLLSTEALWSGSSVPIEQIFGWSVEDILDLSSSNYSRSYNQNGFVCLGCEKPGTGTEREVFLQYARTVVWDEGHWQRAVSQQLRLLWIHCSF
jgi:hypothetical protein